jgi:virulence factor Mce-like protein
VSSIEHRPDGKAVIHLAINPAKLHVIPANVAVNIASTTVFGAKSVELITPTSPSADQIRPGQVIEAGHVTVEVNTIFEQLTAVLSAIQPEKLNQTLTTFRAAFGGRGEMVGSAITDMNSFLFRIESSLPTLSRDLRSAPVAFESFADAAPDLLTIADRVSTISRTVVENRQNLDSLLVNLTGLADTGIDVLATNQRPLADVLHLLAPVTDMTNEYNQALYCTLAGLIPLAKMPPARLPGAEVMASFQWGVDPYRYPSDLPKVAATGGPQCVGLPNLPFETRAPYVVADVGTNPWEYGNQGIALNAAGIKEFLLGHRPDGPPRNSAQIGMPG